MNDPVSIVNNIVEKAKLYQETVLAYFRGVYPSFSDFAQFEEEKPQTFIMHYDAILLAGLHTNQPSWCSEDFYNYCVSRVDEKRKEMQLLAKK